MSWIPVPTSAEESTVSAEQVWESVRPQEGVGELCSPIHVLFSNWAFFTSALSIYRHIPSLSLSLNSSLPAFWHRYLEIIFAEKFEPWFTLCSPPYWISICCHHIIQVQTSSQQGRSYHIIWPGICLSRWGRECDTKLTKSSTRPCLESPFVHLSLPCCFCNSKWISDSLSPGLFKPNGLVRSQGSRCCSAQHLHLPIQTHLSPPTLKINQRDLSVCFKLWCLSGVCLSSSLFLGVCSWHLGVGGN